MWKASQEQVPSHDSYQISQTPFISSAGSQMQFYNHPKFNVMSQKNSSVLFFHEATKQTTKMSQVMMKLQVLVTSVLNFFSSSSNEIESVSNDDTQSPGHIHTYGQTKS